MKRYQYALSLLGVAAALAGLLAGCGKKKASSTAAAVVGTDTIDVKTIADAFEQTRHLFKNAEEELSEKQKLLDLLVEERLLIQEGYRQKIDQDSAVLAYQKIQDPMFLIDQLYFQEVREKVKLTDQELTRLYEALKQDRCLKRILHHDKKVADYVANLLRKGENFDSLVRIHSEDPTRHYGGTFGCFGWSNPPEGHFESVLKLKPGEWIGPVDTEKGWAILYCHQLMPAKLPSFAEIGPALKNLVTAEREKSRSAQFVRELRNGLNFRLIDTAQQYANLKQKELSKTTMPNGQVLYASRIRTEELTPAEREMALATYEGGKITLLDFLNQLQGSIPAGRYVLDTTETTRAVLFQLIFQNVMVNAAKQRGLDNNPDYRRLLRQAVEGQMALVMKNSILQKAAVDSAHVRAYFNAHPEEFVSPAAFYLFEINHPSEAELKNVKPSLKSRVDFSATAAHMTTREQMQDRGGELGWVEQFQFPELFASASKMKTGQIGGPVPLADGTFSLIYLDDRRASRKLPFAEVAAPLHQHLLSRAQDSIFNAWVAGQKTKMKITTFPEVLQKTIDYERYARLKEEEAKKPGGRS